MAFEVHVDAERCEGCEECLEVCTVEVFQMQGSRSVPVREGECLGCDTCLTVCKANAITIVGLQPRLSEMSRLLLRPILE